MEQLSREEQLSYKKELLDFINKKIQDNHIRIKELRKEIIKLTEENNKLIPKSNDLYKSINDVDYNSNSFCCTSYSSNDNGSINCCNLASNGMVNFNQELKLVRSSLNSFEDDTRTIQNNFVSASNINNNSSQKRFDVNLNGMSKKEAENYINIIKKSLI